MTVKEGMGKGDQVSKNTEQIRPITRLLYVSIRDAFPMFSQHLRNRL